MRKKLGLALGSGGARGVSHVGFLQALEEAGIRADYVTGCSMGSIVGALYCAGIDMKTVKEKVLKLKLSQIASLNVTPIHANGLFRMNKARKLLEEYMGDISFSELKIPFCCVSVDMVSGKLIALNEGNVIDAVIASSSIPGAFTPVMKDNMMLVDGGVLERVPTKELKQMGAEAIVAIDVLGDLTVKKSPSNLVESLLRCIDIMDTRTTQRKKQSRSRNIDLWLEPDLGAMDQYKVKNLQFAYEKGYELGKENIDTIKKLIGE
ncbi:MAG: patatin-like phospholipase family protein [Clostridia bacterium]|jgi:NTE family protein|nr:patatin-like phospholipase family protein [Clostridia bacterium]